MSGGLVRDVGRGVWIWFDKDLLSVILSLPVEIKLWHGTVIADAWKAADKASSPHYS